MKSIEEQIKKAMEEGQFKDLKGKGKPLNLDENPFADPDWRLAHHVLQTGGYSLPWIETRHELENEISALEIALQSAWEWRQEAQAQSQDQKWVETEWQRALSAFEERVSKLNKHIRDFNLSVPSDRFQLPLLQARRILTRVTGE